MIITKAFTDGGQVVSVLSYFANRVAAQVQFTQLGPVTQHFLQLLQAHASRENTQSSVFGLFSWGFQPGKWFSVNAAVHAVDLSEANMMHIYRITNQRQTRGEPPFQGTLHELRFQGPLAESINNTSVYFNKQCRRCHVTESSLLGAAWGWLAPPASCPELCVYLKGALIQAWKYEYSLDTLWLFVAFLSWPKALPLFFSFFFQLVPQSVC